MSDKSEEVTLSDKLVINTVNISKKDEERNSTKCSLCFATYTFARHKNRFPCAILLLLFSTILRRKPFFLTKSCQSSKAFKDEIDEVFGSQTALRTR